MVGALWTLAVLAGGSVLGCAKGFDSGGSRTVLTEHQRDSVLAKSPLPGATVVGRALQVSDQADRRAAQFGATVDSLAP
jgi:hypothetical protein